MGKSRAHTRLRSSFQQLDLSQQRHFFLLSIERSNKAHHRANKAEDAPNPAHARDHAQQSGDPNHQSLVDMKFGTLTVSQKNGDQQTDSGEIRHNIRRFLIQILFPLLRIYFDIV